MTKVKKTTVSSVVKTLERVFLEDTFETVSVYNYTVLSKKKQDL